MADEAISSLSLKKGSKVLDATLGLGGHAEMILEEITPGGILIGIDRDEKTLEIANKRLYKYSKSYKLIHANFKDIDKVLPDSGIENIDAALFDLGTSSYQLGDAKRGFSFRQDGPLDMRMDLSSKLSAYEIVNKARREDLESIIRDFGEERYFRKITDFILEERRKKTITSTRQLSDVIRRAVGKKYRSRKIDPATRTFQAIRIAVNDELGVIGEGLGKTLDVLEARGRLVVISFHSLEDRIVKNRFKEFKKEEKALIITKKPLVPTREEIMANRRSRSAKLRVLEKL